MCIVEEKLAKEGNVHISTLSVCPATGDVVWDDFDGAPIDRVVY